jgi:hypothetical protein
MELFLAGYPGFHATTPPSSASGYGVYWPALVPAELVTHRVVLPDGTAIQVPHGPTETLPIEKANSVALVEPVEPTARLALGTICAARSGDKGGNANIGLWTRTAAEFEWLDGYLTVDKLRELLPEAAELDVRRYRLPNLNALNFIVVGLLGSGVAATARPDAQAKGLGEYLRSRYVDIPESLLGKEAAR